jgi:hypothetical protein
MKSYQSHMLWKKLALFFQIVLTPQQCWGLKKLGLFFCPAKRKYPITTFQIRYYADLPDGKLALFFQIPFRNTHHAIRNTN